MAAVDVQEHPPHLVKRIALHPLDHPRDALELFLKDKFKHSVKVKVLSRSCRHSDTLAAKMVLSSSGKRFEMKDGGEETEETWEDVSLCMDVVGGDTCTVEYPNGMMKLIKASDLRLATTFARPLLLDEVVCLGPCGTTPAS